MKNENLLFDQNPTLDRIENYSKTKSIYKELNKYGYKLFSLSLVTINLIKDYGPENIYSKLKDLQVKIDEVIKNVNFSSETKPDTYDSTRKAVIFYRIIELKQLDSKLYDIVIAATNDIKNISELSDWFGENDPANDTEEDNLKKYLFITLTFLISFACEPAVKKKDGIQGFHSDYNIIKKVNDDGSENEYYQKNYPLSVIIALEDKTFFRLLCNSHNQYDDNGLPNGSSYNCKLLELSQGQIIIFHPNLIHSGKI